MRFIGLLMIAGVIGFSNSAEGQKQDLDGGQGVIWVEGGIDSEVPENAIRVLVGAGLPLCRGTLAEDQGQPDFWLDIGVVTLKEASGRGKCRTLRIKRGAPILQENFYYLVPADTEGEVSTEGMVSADEVQAAVAEATAHLEAELQAAHEQKLADEVELGKAEDLYSLKMKVRKFCEMYLDHPNAINPEEDEYTFVQSNMTQITWCNGLNLGD